MSGPVEWLTIYFAGAIHTSRVVFKTLFTEYCVQRNTMIHKQLLDNLKLKFVHDEERDSFLHSQYYARWSSGDVSVIKPTQIADIFSIWLCFTRYGHMYDHGFWSLIASGADT